MKNIYLLASIYLIIGTIFAAGCAAPEGNSAPSTHKDSEVEKNALEKPLNKLASSWQKNEEFLSEWLDKTNKVLGIEPKQVEEERSRFGKLSDEAIKHSGYISKGLGAVSLGAVSFGARVAGYFGVPFASAVADITGYGKNINVVGGVIQNLKPEQRKENWSNVKNLFSKIKSSTWGLSDSDLQEASKVLGELEQKAQKTETYFQQMEGIFGIINEITEAIKKDADSFNGYTVRKKLYQDLGDILVVLELLKTIENTGLAIQKNLEPYRKKTFVEKAISSFNKISQEAKKEASRLYQKGSELLLKILPEK